MVRRIISAALGVLAAALIAGCQGDPNHGQYTRSRPDPAAIIGLWTLDATASGWHPPALDAPPQTIKFNANETIISQNIPDVWNNDDRLVKGISEAGSGTWRIRNHQDVWVLEVNLSEINGKGPGQIRILNLVGQSPPYQLLAVIGDPDDGRALVFRKGG